MGQIQGGYRGPDIVGDGLVLYLDVNSKSSYQSFNRGDVTDFGNTWRDISGNDNNGTLVNNPTFSSNNGGFFNYNGTNTGANLPTRTFDFSQGCTIEFWCNPTVHDNGRRLVDFGGSSGNSFLVYQDPNTRLTTQLGNSQPSSNTNISTLGAWQQLVFLANKVSTDYYKNGVLDRSLVDSTVPTTISRTPRIGTNQFGTEVFSGGIAVVRIYNRGLTATEILQNYNATKARFGL